MNNKDFLEEMKAYFKVTSIEEVAEKLGYKRNTAATWRSRGISNTVKLKFESIKSNDLMKQPDNNSTTIALPRLSMTASAGMGNSLEGIEVFNTGEIIHIDKAIFKTPPKNNLGIIQVDGYSMVPMLLPDSWVIYEETKTYTTDGMYILNWRNNLMVKLLQLNLSTGALDIISVNKDYQSYTTSPDDQSSFYIIGKVIKVII